MYASISLKKTNQNLWHILLIDISNDADNVHKIVTNLFEYVKSRFNEEELRSQKSRVKINQSGIQTYHAIVDQ